MEPTPPTPSTPATERPRKQARSTRTAEHPEGIERRVHTATKCKSTEYTTLNKQSSPPSELCTAQTAQTQTKTTHRHRHRHAECVYVCILVAVCCMCCAHCEWGYEVCMLCAVWVGAAPWSVCLCVGHRLCGEDIDCGVSEGCSPRHTACRMRKEANPLLRSTLHADCKKAPSTQHKLQHAHTDQPLLDITQSTHRNTHT